jgi:hypothetical protein
LPVVFVLVLFLEFLDFLANLFIPCLDLCSWILSVLLVNFQLKMCRCVTLKFPQLLEVTPRNQQVTKQLAVVVALCLPQLTRLTDLSDIPATSHEDTIWLCQT